MPALVLTIAVFDEITLSENTGYLVAGDYYEWRVLDLYLAFGFYCILKYKFF